MSTGVPMAGWWLLVFAVLGALLVVNAARPLTGPIMLLPSWLLAFLTTDLAFFHIGLQVIVAAAFIWGGALETLPGKLALVLMLASTVWLIVLWLPSLHAARVTRNTAEQLELDATPAVPRGLLWKPFARSHQGVQVTRGIEFFRAAGRVLELDVYRPETNAEGRPALVYLHGGGWVMGDKRDQGLPLCNHLATLGWVCVNANYRLSPAATHPDQVVDAKAAIAWLRANAEEYGVDPGFVAIAGGSAGGHIAAMTALTPGERILQPGFEDDDSSIQAAVTFYGVYDLTNRLGSHNPEFLTDYIGPLVVKAFPETELERFQAASPLDQVDKVTMPWLILQGDRDTLTPVADARAFAEQLASASKHPVGYAEFPGAQHAFDIYYSHRAIAAVELASRFLVTSHRRAANAR